MTAIKIVSIFQTLRPCLKCGTEFYPPKRPDRLILDYCSPTCEKAAGLRPMKRCYSAPAPIARRTGRPDRSYGPQPRPDIPRTALAAQMIRHRVAARITQRGVGLAIGVAQSTVANWESDHASPSPQHLAAMADLFTRTSGQRVTMDDLWRGDARDGARRGEEAV